MVQGQTKTHTHLRRRLLTIFLATAFIALISTLVVYFTERHVKGGEIHNLFDAFLFSTSQLLTASSVANPKTNFGKVLELFFDIWAITVVATVAGSFGAFFHAAAKRWTASWTASSAAWRARSRRCASACSRRARFFYGATGYPGRPWT